MPKTIGNRKRDCAWECAGVKKLKKNQLLSTNHHQVKQIWDLMICAQQLIFLQFLTPAHPHAQSLFLFPIVFGINIYPVYTFPSAISPLHLPQCYIPSTPSPVLYPLYTFPSAISPLHLPQCYIPSTPSPVLYPLLHLPQCYIPFYTFPSAISPSTPSPVLYPLYTFPSAISPSTPSPVLYPLLHLPQCYILSTPSPVLYPLYTFPSAISSLHLPQCYFFPVTPLTITGSVFPCCFLLKKPNWQNVEKIRIFQ